MKPQITARAKQQAERFLRNFGLRRSKHVFTEQFWQDVRATGVDPESILANDDGFGRAAAQVYFATEEIARRSLSHDYDRLISQVASFETLQGFPSKPRKIVELGGGTGLLSMWLARRHPEAEVVVYDWAEPCTSLGAKWAQRQGIRNIRFVTASYEEIASDQLRHDADLVCMFHGLDLSFQPPEELNLFRYRSATPGDLASSPSDVKSAALALAAMVKSDGVVVMNGSWSHWGLMCLLERLRETELGIDWTLSIATGTVRDQEFALSNAHLFLRPEVPRVAISAWEEMAAFMSMASLVPVGLPLVHNGLLESFADVFEGGRELRVLEGRWESGGTERLRLITKGGLLLLEHTSTLGFRRGAYHSLGAIGELIDHLHSAAAHWDNNGAVQITRDEWHPDLVAYARFLDLRREAV